MVTYLAEEDLITRYVPFFFACHTPFYLYLVRSRMNITGERRNKVDESKRVCIRCRSNYVVMANKIAKCCR